MAVKNILMGGDADFLPGINQTLTDDLNDTFDRLYTIARGFL